MAIEGVFIEKTVLPYDVVVSETAVNRFPVIESLPVRFAIAGETYEYPIEASDPDNDPLTYDVEGLPRAIVDGNGLLTWTPALEGTYTFNVTASDGEEVAAPRFELRVRDIVAPTYYPVKLLLSFA